MSKKDGVRSFGLSGRSDHVRAIVYVSWVLAFGSTDAALFMFMLSRWYDKGSREDGYIYKSIPDIEHETGLKRTRQESIRKKLTTLGVISTQVLRVGETKVMHFKLHAEKAQQLITKAEKELDTHNFSR